ncbi:MAG: serine--tRNA ligase [Solirubrobacterales bacterium]|nr:serine--tRNA ligase [Solirubrobacterales bacterium]
MLDLKLIRSDPDAVRAGLERRGAAGDLDRVIDLDARRREILPELEAARGERKEASEKIGEAKREGREAEAEMEEVRLLKGKMEGLEAELESVESELDGLVAALPNLPEPEAPDGEDDSDAVVLREVGEKPEFEFEPRDHVELAEGRIELEQAAKASGARFAYLMGDLVLVELALVRWVLGLLAEEGYEPVIPPVLVREEALFGTGFLPGDRDQIYEVEKDELFLAGTAEVPLASLLADQILEADQLPARFAGFSPCFRREAGAAGRDTHGIFRVHQFDKVEMFSFVAPDESRDEHLRILGIEERILGELDLPYRVVDIPVGDLGAPAARKFDCEAWIPSQGRYRELTSCSNTTDFQARRLACRFRPEPDGKPEIVHTLNGTAIAVGRTIIALLENGQQADGSVTLPAVLQEFGAPERIG